MQLYFRQERLTTVIFDSFPFVLLCSIRRRFQDLQEFGYRDATGLSRGVLTLAATQNLNPNSPDATGLSRGVLPLAAKQNLTPHSPDATGLVPWYFTFAAN